MFTIRALVKRYGSRSVLNGVTFTAEAKKITSILGTSGSGKSTLLKTMIGAVKPDEGEVLFNGTDISKISGQDLDRYRRRIGMLFQQGALINTLTVFENVALPMREHTTLDENIVRIMVKMKLEMVGLRDFEDLMPSQLSAGMHKRIALARAIALDPEIIFFDEPTSGLDPIVASVVTKLIADLNRLMGITCIVVTHAVEEALKIADKIVILHMGKVLAEGPPSEIGQSVDQLVQQFITGSADGPLSFRASSKDYREDLLVG